MEIAFEKLKELLQGDTEDKFQIVLENLLDLFQLHVQRLSKAEEETKKKVNSEEISTMIEKIAQNLYIDLRIHSPVKKISSAKFFGEEMTSALEDPQSVKLKQSLSALGENLELISASVNKLNQARMGTEKRILSLERNVDNAVSRELLKNEIHILSDKIENQVNTQSAEITKTCSEFQKMHTTDIENLNRKMTEIESQALWKLRDCQDLMKTRVSEEFLECKLKYFEKQQNQNFDDQRSKMIEMHNTLDSTVRTMFESINKKHNQSNSKFKMRFNAAEAALNSKLTVQYLDDYKKNIDAIITSLTDDISSFNRHICSFEEKIAEINKRTNELSQTKKPLTINLEPKINASYLLYNFLLLLFPNITMNFLSCDVNM